MSSDDLVPTKLAYERKYSDGSGIELGVYWDGLDYGEELTIKAGADSVTISKDDAQTVLLWMTKIASEVGRP